MDTEPSTVTENQLPTEPPLPTTSTPIQESATTSPVDPTPIAEPGQPVVNPALEAIIAQATQVAPTVSSGGVETMTLLDSLYSDVTAISKRIETSGLQLVHEDTTDLEEALNIARTWLVGKLKVYNPQHASLLNDIPAGPTV